ncbi:transcription antitermination factor NusB [Buchnera aphidicola]|uniref:Transcription antitermination protein NusB n=1 Tax=Buchnera aphidicola (Cinara strobi) TaxID=1921549 RepID=A0A3B1DWN8_9GAMM|nr:transcription antitermination factor NusB [Buchnera aphidicola]VAX76723.1 Transcription antitermination protein NusB [Buchnera aphidicola (Cinara strobi)]
MIPSKRRKARELAIQALYSWHVSNNSSVLEIKKYVIKQNKTSILDKEYFNEIVDGVIQNVDYLDRIIKLYLSRKIQRLDIIEKAILRLSSYEIIQRLDIPYKVIINEGIELAKTFGSQTSHKFINSILDKITLKVIHKKKKIKKFL